MLHQSSISIYTKGRGSYELTDQVQQVVAEAKAEIGLCHLFIQHTSASLMICENADATVRSDLEAFMARLVPDGDGLYRHTLEGPDDMPAHVRSVLTQSSITIPVSNHRAALGTWQGVYLWEHRTSAHQRRVIVTVEGQ
ncbi:secondary thiamine-phosphate synthase enzyme YjbQ [Kaarinaea lacus]